MQTILCYGDSNTWGFVPNSINYETFYMERFSREIRWTGILQKKLGPDCYVVEEGMNGRTTNVDYAEVAGRNGKTFLPVCLYSHAPLDLVILFLGCNDLKAEFNRSAKEIALGLDELIKIINASTFGHDMQSPPQVLLIGYPVPAHEHGYKELFDLTGAIARAKQFDKYFSQIAEQNNCYYFNAAPHVSLCEADGIHFDEQGHGMFAELIFRQVKNILL